MAKNTSRYVARTLAAVAIITVVIVAFWVGLWDLIFGKLLDLLIG
jgi:hypothetical protein